MPRKMRNLGNTGWAHIIVRGINRENLFFDEEDFSRFYDTILRFREECGFELAIACLMDNHVHLLVRDENGAYADFMKKITVSYAHYYNTKYDRVGHVFQDRFRSEPINDERYFLTVLRYIYQNPQKAGISSADTYPYTFLNENETLSGYFNSKESLMVYLSTENDDNCMDFESSNSMVSDRLAAQIFAELTGSHNPTLVQGMEKADRDRLISELKRKGLSVRQISRLTGVNRNVIQRAGS